MATIRVKTIESINNTTDLISIENGKLYTYKNDFPSNLVPKLHLSFMLEYSGRILYGYIREFSHDWVHYNNGIVYIWHKHVEEIIDGKE